MKDELEILLVEDDDDSRVNLQDILELDGHHIHVARTFAQVREAGVQPGIRLAILDRRLPDGDVEELLPELKPLLPNADFVITTGYADIENSIAAFRLGVVDYVIKPIQPDLMRQSVARIARQQQSDCELSREQRFAKQVLSTAEAIVLVLDLEGRVVRFNPYFTRVSGWELNDLQGKDWFTSCIFEGDCDRLREVFMKAAHDTNGTVVANAIRTVSGRARQIRWSNTTLKNDEGQVTSVLSIGIDATELAAAIELAQRSKRLAAIGETVAGLAHESRNALHRIQASVEILQWDIPAKSSLREEVDSIQRATVELRQTLEEVRQYAAPIQLAREPALLPEIWRRAWGHLASTRDGRDVELVETSCDCENYVDIDVMRMEQLFRNLFENSLAACNDPMRIHLSCQCDGADWVLLDIQDNGPGLSAEQRERIFEPFFTTKSRGTGLGMSIVQRIVDAHGGEIHVAEPNGQGARFLVRVLKNESASHTGCPLQQVATNA